MQQHEVKAAQIALSQCQLVVRADEKEKKASVYAAIIHPDAHFRAEYRAIPVWGHGLRLYGLWCSCEWQQGQLHQCEYIQRETYFSTSVCHQRDCPQQRSNPWIESQMHRGFVVFTKIDVKGQLVDMTEDDLARVVAHYKH